MAAQAQVEKRRGEPNRMIGVANPNPHSSLLRSVFEVPQKDAFAYLQTVVDRGILAPIKDGARLENPELRRQLIREAMGCILDIRSGHGNALTGNTVVSGDREAVTNFLWNGLQTTLVNIAGGDTDLLTLCLSEFVEESLGFIAPRPQWVEVENSKNLPIQMHGVEQTVPHDDGQPGTAERVETGESVAVQIEKVMVPQPTRTIHHGDKDYVLSEPILPRDMTQKDAEYVLTSVAQLLTTGPLVTRLNQRVLEKKDAHGSTQLRPVWETVVTSLRGADKSVVGNWLANVRSEKETPRAGRTIIEWASGLNDAADMAEAITPQKKEGMDGIINGIIAQTEFFPDEFIKSADGQIGAQVLREYIMTLFNTVSRAGVLDALSSVIGESEIETADGPWLRELAKVLRDSGYNPKQDEPTNLETTGDKALGNVLMSQMQTGAVPISGSDAYRQTMARALCGTVATYPNGKGGLVNMALPQLLVLQPRKVGSPGRPLLMMTHETTSEQQQERISEFLLTQTNTLLSLVAHANGVDTARSPGETLNVQQRVATLVGLWAHILSERPNEQMDELKNEARGRFLGTMISWYYSGHQSELVSGAIEQAIRVVGLRWPEASLKDAVQQVVDRGPIVGKDTRKKAKHMAALLGVIQPDLTLNLGKAKKVIAVADVEKATKNKGKSQAKIKAEMGINYRDVFTPARRFLVAAEKSLIENIARSTQNLTRPERRQVRESILGALADLNLIYEIQVLAENNTPQSMIALAHALRTYNDTFGVQNMQETAPIFASINSVIAAAESAGIHHEIPQTRLGNKTARNVARLPKMDGAHVKLNEQDVRRLLDYAHNVFEFSTSTLGDSLDIVDAYATEAERAEIGSAIGAQLKKQIAYILQEQDAPHSYARLIAALESRVNAIDQRVRASGRALMGDGSMLTMGDTFESSFAAQIEKMEHTQAQKLVDTAKKEEATLRGELEGEIGKMFQDAESAVTLLGKDRLYLAKEIMSTVMSPLGVSISGTQVAELMKLFTGSRPKDGTPDELGAILSKALTMVGAAGFGYAIGSRQSTAVENGANLAVTLQAQSAQLADAQVHNYREAARVKRDTVIGSLEHIYATRLRYFQNMMDAATAVQATTVVDGLRLQQNILEKQYAEIQKAVEGVFGFTEQLVDLRIKGLGLSVREAQETYDHIVKFMETTRPIVRNMIRMANVQWGVDISPGMKGWDEPEIVLGITPDGAAVQAEEKTK
jgi:hypothetical protein